MSGPIVRAVRQATRLQEISETDTEAPRVRTDFHTAWASFVQTFSLRTLLHHQCAVGRDGEVGRHRAMDPRTTLTPRVIERPDGLAYVSLERPRPHERTHP